MSEWTLPVLASGTALDARAVIEEYSALTWCNMSIREAISQKILETGGRLRVRSALNPVLWLCAIITVPGLYFASQMVGPPAWLITLIFLPLVAAIAGFLFLLFFDRDKLNPKTIRFGKWNWNGFRRKAQFFLSILHRLRKLQIPVCLDIKSLWREIRNHETSLLADLRR